MAKNILKIIAFFIIGMAGGIFSTQIFWPYFVERPLFYKYGLEQTPVYVTERKEVTIQENTALQDAIEKTEKTVVGIKTQLKNGIILEGSGLIVSSDGLIVTFAGLVPQGAQINLFWEGKTPSYQILKRDLKENLALIKMENSSNVSTPGFADLDKIKLGERVFLLGIIFEKDGSLNKITNEGIIKTFDDNLIQTNIFEKNTLLGSPLFDIEGKVLGLNTIDKEGKVAAVSIKKIRTFLGF
jgi:S1-C subfamily serine protease